MPEDNSLESNLPSRFLDCVVMRLLVTHCNGSLAIVTPSVANGFKPPFAGKTPGGAQPGSRSTAKHERSVICRAKPVKGDV